MALLDELPLEILLAVVKWLRRKNWDDSEFCKLLPVANASTGLRRSLLPLLYRDLVFTFTGYGDATFHNVALANSAGCSEYVQRVTLFINGCNTPDDIVRAVRDDMDAGSATKWPNLRSYAYIHMHECCDAEDSLPWSDNGTIMQLDKELPKLCRASPATCGFSSGIAPLDHNPPSASFSTQLTSLRLSCATECIEPNRFPQLFAPTLVDLVLGLVNPESVWNIFYDGQEGQTVVFAKLNRLVIDFRNPLYWGQNGDLPPHLQGATNGVLAKRSVWTAGAASGKPGCRVPLFPVLRTLKCYSMAYGFHDFISRTQCHSSLVSLYVTNGYAYFDFNIKLFKTLETVEFSTYFRDTDEERTSSVDLYKSAFTSLLRTKTSLQRMAFESYARDTIFQVPPNIGCANLRSLLLGVEVDFKSMLRLLSNLKHLIELELNVDYAYIYNVNGEQENGAGYIDELQPPQAEYLPVSSTLRRFMCRLCTPRVRGCYTASYAIELALHLPALESMTLGVDDEGDVAFYEAMLGKFLEEMSRSPYKNDGLLNAKKKITETAQLTESNTLFSETKRSSAVYSWLEKVELIQETYDLDDEATAAVAATRLSSNIAAEYARHRRTEDKQEPQNIVSVREFMTDNYGYIPLAKDTAQTSLEPKYHEDIAQHTCSVEHNFTMMGAPHNDVLVCCTCERGEE
ncbi:hypothetical protein GQ54DRAFT_306387 [Martensiomyces pterosporus]|nr:hypothetical protein GQ54DRAFT_306387 [Martensiomyces pterosporus]